MSLSSTCLKLAALTFALAITGCDAGPGEDGADDHAIGVRTFEGDELAALFGTSGTSDPINVDHGFRRVGLLWDAPTADILEVRTSADGQTWGAWTAPHLVSSEEGAHAGHVDAVTVGDDGSTTSDPTVAWLQVRLVAGKAAPSFLVIEPLVDIPGAFDPDATVEETDEGEGGDKPNLFSNVQSTPIGSIRIYSRADWGGRAPRCASGAMSPNRATIHHTVTPTVDSLSPQARLRQIQSFHMFTNGWCDIGYNYLVSRDGRVWRGRGANTVGAHVTNNNTGNVGISFMGTHTSTAPTQTQMCNAAKLIRRLHEDYGALALNRTDIKGHRQYGGTACPGTALYNRIDEIIRKSKSGC